MFGVVGLAGWAAGQLPRRESRQGWRHRGGTVRIFVGRKLGQSRRRLCYDEPALLAAGLD